MLKRCVFCRSTGYIVCSSPEEANSCANLVEAVFDNHVTLNDHPLGLVLDDEDRELLADPPIIATLQAENVKLKALNQLQGEQIETLTKALKGLRIDANRLCDRQLGGSYEDDCRRAIAVADAALGAKP